jgi:hypothetical protein
MGALMKALKALWVVGSEIAFWGLMIGAVSGLVWIATAVIWCVLELLGRI